MGAWGEKAFENDSALDWLAELEEEGVDALRSLLATVADTDADDYLDVDDGSAAIAAAGIVAAARGKGRDRVPEEVIAWLDANAEEIDVEDEALAKRALARALAGESELRALWDENGPDSEWHADVRVLVGRLGGDVGALAPLSETSGGHGDEERSKTVLLTFLQARGLEPSAKQLARIHASTDGAEIQRWLGRALHAPSVEAVLDEPATRP